MGNGLPIGVEVLTCRFVGSPTGDGKRCNLFRREQSKSFYTSLRGSPTQTFECRHQIASCLPFSVPKITASDERKIS
jgi:hypothetical protein